MVKSIVEWANDGDSSEIGTAIFDSNFRLLFREKRSGGTRVKVRRQDAARYELTRKVRVRGGSLGHYPWWQLLIMWLWLKNWVPNKPRDSWSYVHSSEPSLFFG